MSLIPGSHKIRFFAKKFFWNLTGNLKYTYLNSIEVKKYCKNEAKLVTKDEFGVFIVDTRGLHKANPLIYGERRVMVFNFRENRFDLAL
jgi:hypothetical protein